MLIGGLLRGCVIRPTTGYPGSHFNHGTNATWIGVEWVDQLQSDASILALADMLHQHQIRYVFVYVSYLKADGTFNQTYAYSRSFLASLRRAAPDLNILAWIGLPLETTHLTDQAVRDRIVRLCATLTGEIGFDGVHLDPEPVDDGNPALLTLLEQIRQGMPGGKRLSLATRVIAPVFPAIVPRLVAQFWSSAYYQQIARRVDQLALMTYDSGLPSPALYRLWTRFQIIQLSQALADTKIEVLIGVPASEEDTATHHPLAENVQSGLQGVLDGLNDADSQPSVITGVALYPCWALDPAKWQIYDQLWGAS